MFSARTATTGIRRTRIELCTVHTSLDIRIRYWWKARKVAGVCAVNRTETFNQWRLVRTLRFLFATQPHACTAAAWHAACNFLKAQYSIGTLKLVESYTLCAKASALLSRDFEHCVWESFPKVCNRQSAVSKQ